MDALSTILPLEALKERKNVVLRSLYIGMTALSAFMLIPKDGITPPEIVQKYAGETAVHLSHTLPSAIWAGLTPFQLNPNFRKNRPTLHRVFGYAFTASAVAMVAGMGIILKRRLLFSNFFPDLPAEGVPPEFAIVALGTYFAFTLLYAIYFARRRQFAEHQRWIIRHVASGMWVSVQRILLVVVYSAVIPRPVPRAVQRKSFGDAAGIGTFISLVLGELAVYLLSPEKKKRVD